jgi:hypothetical protein
MYSGNSENVKNLIAKAMPGTIIEVRIEDLGAYVAEKVSDADPPAEKVSEANPPSVVHVIKKATLLRLLRNLPLRQRR